MAVFKHFLVGSGSGLAALALLFPLYASEAGQMRSVQLAQSTDRQTAERCPGNSSWDSLLKQCSCEAGQSWDRAAQKCVGYDATYTPRDTYETESYFEPRGSYGPRGSF